jgi:flagellar biosynthetic protein FliQ
MRQRAARAARRIGRDAQSPQLFRRTQRVLTVFDSLDLVRDALILSLVLSAPILAVGLVVGLLISIVQAVTQIQDQTISFVPKIASMLVVAVALLGWLSVQLVEFAATMFTTF